MTIVDAFLKTITFLDELKREGFIEDYAMIGGLALSAWIRPRTTRDVDMVVITSGETTWADLVSAIETKFHKRVSVHKASPRTVIREKLSFMSGHIQVDIIGTKDFDLAEEAIRNALVADVLGKAIKVASPEYLILLKLLPLSGQDALDIRSLAKKADKQKLVSLAHKHFLLPKLQSVLSRK